jgi:phage terminase large subunit-like protein
MSDPIYDLKVKEEDKNYILYYLSLINKNILIVSDDIRTVYEKLAYDIENPKEGYFYDNEEALRAINFIQNFCFRKENKKKRVKLMVFQKAIVSAVFGFRRKIEGENYTFRRFEYVSYLVARKNGKSFLSACMILYMILSEKAVEYREIFSVANSLEQSKVIYDDVKFLINNLPYLKRKFTEQKSFNKMIYKKDLSFFKPLSSDTDAADGKRADYIIFDELHQFNDRKNGGIFNLLRDSNSASPSPLLFICSTFGFLRNNVFDIEMRYMRKIIDKIKAKEELNDAEYSVLPLIYKLDKESEILEMETEDIEDSSKIRFWQKANPGIIFTEEERIVEGTKEGIKILKNLRNKFAQYFTENKAELRNLLVKDFNVISTGREAFLSFSEIENKEKFDIFEYQKTAEKKDRFRYCFIGIDLTRSNDLGALSFMFLKKNDPNFYVMPYFFLPESSLERKIEKKEFPYDKWVADGLITESGKDIIRIEDIFSKIKEVVKDTNCVPIEISYDAWSAIDLISKLQDEFGNELTRSVKMDKRNLTEPFIRLGILLQAKNLIYNDNQVLKWNFLNTETEWSKDGKFCQPVKSNIEQKIDGTIATICCIDSYLRKKNEYSGLIE